MGLQEAPRRYCCCCCCCCCCCYCCCFCSVARARCRLPMRHQRSLVAPATQDESAGPRRRRAVDAQQAIDAVAGPCLGASHPTAWRRRRRLQAAVRAARRRVRLTGRSRGRSGAEPWWSCAALAALVGTGVGTSSVQPKYIQRVVVYGGPGAHEFHCQSKTSEDSGSFKSVSF